MIELYFSCIYVFNCIMDISDCNTKFLLDLFEYITPSNMALFLRLIRLYPMNIVDNQMEREQMILTIFNETTDCSYTADIWPKIMAINRIPKLVEQVLSINVDQRLLLAIEKLQFQFELQMNRFVIHQLVPSITICRICSHRLQEPKFDELNIIITRDNVYPCVMYKKECCDLTYRYGHVRNRRTRERFVTIEEIFNQQFIHLFDNVIYERRLVVAFTNLLYESATSFQSYTNATNLDIDQNKNFNRQPAATKKLSSKFFSTV